MSGRVQDSAYDDCMQCAQQDIGVLKVAPNPGRALSRRTHTKTPVHMRRSRLLSHAGRFFSATEASD